MINRFQISLFYSLLLLFLTACSNKAPVGNTGLQTSSPETQNLDPDKLSELDSRVAAGDYGAINSIIIIRNESVVMEKYYRGLGREDLHYVYSVTKSVTSALIGIALNNGEINRLDETLLSFFPEYSNIENMDERKTEITLENILTMSAGFIWDEWTQPYGHPQNGASLLFSSADWMKHMLDLPIIEAPGTRFRYNSGCTMLLSGILANSTERTAENFATEHLFESLGMKWRWETGPGNITNTGWGLFLRPIDMVQFGLLYLNNGRLNNEQIVPEEWVQTSTQTHINTRNYNYGYQWWRFKDNSSIVSGLAVNDVYFAWGYRGQFIFVIPHLNMVAISTADNVENSTRTFGFLRDYIFGAVLDS